MGELICRRCGGPVVASAAEYAEMFEQMHYVCFHYEFEHDGDVDVACVGGGCPASVPRVSSLLAGFDGVQLAEAANTLVPAVLALEAAGYTVTQEDGQFVATIFEARIAAADPVTLLGLARLAELRRPWPANDAETDDVLARFRF